VRLAIEITSALEEPHAHGISYRDLRPANMPMTTTGGAINTGDDMKKIGIACFAAVLAVMAVATANAETACDRACLTRFVDTYFNALVANNPSAVPLTASAKITTNGRVTKLDQAFWDSAERAVYRWDIVNERLGDTGTEAVILNADGSKTMYMLRLKVLDGRISEVETIKANKGEADALWSPDTLTEVSPALRLSIREADQDSYYALIAAAESYWRAFQTNGTEAYHPASLLPDSRRVENGVQTTGVVRNGAFVSTAQGFDQGRFNTRNIWDRRYPVVDTERGIVLSIVRFGLKDGIRSQNAAAPHESQ
jgi:hypothetical protein